MVRLIGREAQPSRGDRRFQFQNGSINRDNLGIDPDWLMRFNSKMVRLIVLVFFRIGVLLVLFQFQNGSINSEAIRYQRTNPLQSFNSKMVRLIETHIIMEEQKFNMFQFQNGSINSWRLFRSGRTTIKFQFQNGSINRISYQ